MSSAIPINGPILRGSIGVMESMKSPATSPGVLGGSSGFGGCRVGTVSKTLRTLLATLLPAPRIPFVMLPPTFLNEPGKGYNWVLRCTYEFPFIRE